MAGSLGVFVAGDLIGFYLVYALASLPAWGLVIHDRTARAWRAGGLYLTLTLLGEAALLGAFALLAAFAPGESLAITDVLRALPTSPLRDVTIAMLVIGFGLKAGLVPLHVWLPLAHPAAPAPASAVLSGAIIKAGIIGLLRFLPPEATPEAWGGLLAVVGFVTAFWGVACGVTQREAKAVLAYSSVSQMGVATAAFGLGMAHGLPGTAGAVAAYALAHVLAKGALFLSVGVVGAGRLAVLVPALVLALGFGGLPLTGGWFAKAMVKDAFAGDLAAGLAAASAAGSTVLMLHFVRRLAAMEGARPALPLVACWLAMAALAMAVPWALFGIEAPALLTPAELWKALWPVLLGAAGFMLLWRAGDRMPELPQGDVVVLAGPLRHSMARLAAVLAGVETVFRSWPVAGLALLAMSLAFGVALGGAGR
nr:proton-conducting transporter membrane subunit [Neoroseomonas eburnea]